MTKKLDKIRDFVYFQVIFLILLFTFILLFDKLFGNPGRLTMCFLAVLILSIIALSIVGVIWASQRANKKMNKTTFYNKKGALKKIFYFIYSAGVFLVLYWIFVLLFDRLLYNKTKVEEWEMGWGILRSSLWVGTDYYLAPLASFIIASVLSGIFQASHGARRFLWAHIVVFIAVFCFIDTFALCRIASMWDNYPTMVHELTASMLAIICTILIIRKNRKREVFKKPFKKGKIGHYYCLHCHREISYDEYRYGAELCLSCAEGSCMG